MLLIKKFKNAISPVVASALLLVVAVVSVVGFSGWFNEFSSSVFFDVESDVSSSNNLGVEGIFNDVLYLKSSTNSDLSLLSVRDSSGSEVCSFIGDGEVDSNGLIGHWKFDDNKGIIKDYSGNGNDGTLFGVSKLLINFNSNDAFDKTGYNNSVIITGNPNYLTNCVSGGCFDFDGIDDKVSISDSQSLNFSNKEFSISIWIKINNSKSTNTIFQKNGDWTNGPNVGASFGLGYRGTSDSIHAIIADGVTRYSIDTNIYIEDGKFHHLVYVVDRGANIMTLTIDNNQTFSVNISGLADISNNQPLHIGGTNGGNHDLNGSLDEFSIYSKVLNSNEINSIYNSQKTDFIEFVDSKIDKSIKLDGVDNYISIGNQSDFDFDEGEPFTLVVISETSDTYGHYIRRGHNYLLTNRIGLEDISYMYFDNSDSSSFVFQTPSDRESFTPIFIAASYNGTQLKHYLDNTLVDTAGLSSIKNGDFKLAIGAMDESIVANYFKGEIEEIRIYNRYLSKTEIEDLYWYSINSQTAGINKIDLGSCNLTYGSKYDVVGLSGTDKIDVSVIAK